MFGFHRRHAAEVTLVLIPDEETTPELHSECTDYTHTVTHLLYSRTWVLGIAALIGCITRKIDLLARSKQTLFEATVINRLRVLFSFQRVHINLLHL